VSRLWRTRLWVSMGEGDAGPLLSGMPIGFTFYASDKATVNRLTPWPALVSKTVVAIFSKYEMIQERDAQELGSLAEPLG
jgi:hypothetical protein